VEKNLNELVRTPTQIEPRALGPNVPFQFGTGGLFSFPTGFWGECERGCDSMRYDEAVEVGMVC